MKLIYFLLCLVVLMGLNDTLAAQSKEELVSVHGQATDLLGHPLEKVSLKFYARSWYLSSPDARLIITAITDHQGKYEARDLPYGYYAIVATAQGFQTTEVSRVFLSKGDNLVDIGLPVGINHDIPAIEFEGIVRGPDKEPVGQATVTVMSAFNPQIVYRARTDKNGRYKVTTNTPSQYLIYVTKEGYAPSTASSLGDSRRIDFSLSAFSR